MVKQLLALSFVLLLSGCSSFGGGEKITDYTDRSTAYGWLDIDDVDANRLHSVVVFQHRPQTEAPYYHLAVKKFKDGYLFYSHGFINGSFKTYSASGQRCLGFMCGNTIHTYSFGKQGDDVGTAIIKQPGVYNLGAYKLKEVKTGFFEQGKFEIVPADNAPSNQEMLQEILKDVPKGHPVVAERLKKVLN